MVCQDEGVSFDFRYPNSFTIGVDELKRRKIEALCHYYSMQIFLHGLSFPLSCRALIVFACDCADPLQVRRWVRKRGLGLLISLSIVSSFDQMRVATQVRHS